MYSPQKSEFMDEDVVEVVEYRLMSPLSVTNSRFQGVLRHADAHVGNRCCGFPQFGMQDQPRGKQRSAAELLAMSLSQRTEVMMTQLTQQTEAITTLFANQTEGRRELEKMQLELQRQESNFRNGMGRMENIVNGMQAQICDLRTTIEQWNPPSDISMSPGSSPECSQIDVDVSNETSTEQLVLNDASNLLPTSPDTTPSSKPAGKRPCEHCGKLLSVKYVRRHQKFRCTKARTAN